MMLPASLFPFFVIPFSDVLGVDIKLARVMDKLFIQGLDTIFLAITLNAVKAFEISLASSHAGITKQSGR